MLKTLSQRGASRHVCGVSAHQSVGGWTVEGTVPLDVLCGLETWPCDSSWHTAP